jgi:dTDP-4-amino-4,6-dideoxygalactose transaminase
VNDNKYEYQTNGVNSRLDPIQAAVLSINLKYLDAWNARRNQIAQIYLETIQEIGIKTLKVDIDSVFHHFIVESDNRDETRMHLDTLGIKTEIHYPECAEMSYGKFSKNHILSEMPNALNLARKTLSLPMSQWMSDSQVNRVLEAVTEVSTLRSFLGEI